MSDKHFGKSSSLGFLLAGDNYALRKCKGDSAGDRPGLVAESLHHCLVGR